MSRRHLAQGIVGACDDIGGVGGVSGQDSSQWGAQMRQEAAGVVRQPPRHLQEGVTSYVLGAGGRPWRGSSSSAAAQHSWQPDAQGIHLMSGAAWSAAAPLMRFEGHCIMPVDRSGLQL